MTAVFDSVLDMTVTGHVPFSFVFISTVAFFNGAS